MRRAILVVAALSGTAHAGGLGRPNVISARAFGQGGAFTAVADDASALHYNPAGLALQTESSFLVGGELIFAPRTYTPEFADDRCTTDPRLCAPQEPESTPAIVPTLGYVGRFDQGGVPSRIALGVGVWNTFGGQLRYPKMETGVAALDYVQDAVIEIVPGIAYEVNDFLSVGAAFRIGVGLFHIEATAKPADGEFSAQGVGAGASIGMMLRPTENLNIGLVWRSPLTVSTSGSGELLLNPPNVTPVDVEHDQNWPQAASIGVAYRVTPTLRFSAQADWTDWSRVESIVVEFPGRDALRQEYDEDWNDNYAFHIGGEFNATPSLDLRAGYTFDTPAVPERTIERQYLDGYKHCIGAGVGYAITKRWRIDTAFELITGAPMDVEDNSAEWDMAGWPARANVSPGRHEGGVYTFELQAQYRY